MSNDKSIVLQPKRVSATQKDRKLHIHYRSRTGIHLWAFVLMLIGLPAYYLYSSIQTYQSVTVDSKLRYENAMQEQIGVLQATHLQEEEKLRRTVQSEYESIDLKIAAQDMMVYTASEKEDGSLQSEKQELERLKARKIVLERMFDSLQNAGPVDSLRGAELDKALEPWKENQAPSVESATFDDKISYLIIPSLVLVGLLIVFFFTYRSIKGGDVLVVDKEGQQITVRKTNYFAKTKVFSIADAKQFFCKKYIAGGDHTQSYHELFFVNNQNESIKILWPIKDSDDAIYIEQQIEQYLGIEQVHVRGSVG